MEVFNPASLRNASYRSVINQSGKGIDMDRYIYSMQGEGLGSFFGNLLKTAVPLLGRAIKGIVNIAKPHLKAAAKDLITAGAKRGIEKISTNLSHKPHKKSKTKRAKWRSL